MADTSASQIMHDFALHTGLTSSDRSCRRYLWTDAFAVCNFLGLHVEQGDDEALRLAQHLVAQAHQVLGKHRPDDRRSGWISGLSEAEGAHHPTLGGLRIGKDLPERAPGEVIDPELEWERDGQYFHYLTRWMHALERMAQVLGDPTYRGWAFELAKTAHAHFTERSSSGEVKGLHWKMSIDLSRPQVASMGHHDPLDGLLTYQQIQASSGGRPESDLSDEIREMAQLCVGRNWETDDALGIGGLLCDAWRLAQLISHGTVREPALLADLLRASVRGLEALLRQRPFERPATSRLAFREFGLSIGLHAARRLRHLVARGSNAVLDQEATRDPLRVLAQCEPIAADVEGFWREPSNRESPSWRAHRDINEVMFATSLLPGGYLGIESQAVRGLGGSEALDLESGPRAPG
jgi:hypothetical protein